MNPGDDPSSYPPEDEAFWRAHTKRLQKELDALRDALEAADEAHRDLGAVLCVVGLSREDYQALQTYYRTVQAAIDRARGGRP